MSTILQDFSFPIIADPKREVATLYSMLDPEEKDSTGIPLTCRSHINQERKKICLKKIILIRK